MGGWGCLVAVFVNSRRVGNLLPTILTGNHLYSNIFVSFGSGGQASLPTLQLKCAGLTLAARRDAPCGSKINAGRALNYKYANSIEYCTKMLLNVSIWPGLARCKTWLVMPKLL